jgi:hypothetical protein
MPAPIQPNRTSAVVRRSERTRFLLASDDGVGGLDGAIRARDVSAADLQEKPTKPVEAELSHRHSCLVGFDEYGGCHANIAASEASNGPSEPGERGNQKRSRHAQW